MACNGFNHPKDCKCNFRGGHPMSRPPTWNGWKRRSARRFISGPTAICPKCSAPIYYVRGRRGGGTYFDKCGPPWPKHACTDTSRRYSPYGRTGKPRLTALPSEFEKDGWLPFLVRNIEYLGNGTIIHGVALNDPTVLHFGTEKSDLEVDSERPLFFRFLNDKTVVEFNFFPQTSDTSVTETLTPDCRNELDLALLAARTGSPLSQG